MTTTEGEAGKWRVEVEHVTTPGNDHVEYPSFWKDDHFVNPFDVAQELNNEAGMLAHIDDLTDTNKALLEALKLLTLDLGKEWGIDEYPIEYNGRTLLQIAAAAIAKAEGR